MTLPEAHYSLRTLAECWGFSERTLLTWFEDRSDVLRSARQARNGRKQRIELRIPASVAMRVYEEHRAK